MNLITRRAALVAAPMALTVTGCATIEGWFTPALEAELVNALDLAAGVVLSSLGAAQDIAIAQEIATALTALISAVTGQTATVATLAAAAEAAIQADTSLSPLLQGVLIDIVTLAAAALQTGSSATTPAGSGPLGTVFTDIQAAIQLYLNASGSRAGRAVLLRRVR